MNAVFRSIASYVPERVVTNDDLAQVVETSDEWIYSHTGIKRRHIAAEAETTSVLAVRAAQAAVERSGLRPEELDLVLLATATPDNPGFPATSCLVAERIGAVNAGAMDLVAACTGFIYGVETGARFITGGGARNVLVIAAEKLSGIVDWNDRSTSVLFGDGAGAAVLSAGEDGRGVLRSVLRAEGSGFDYLHLIPFDRTHANLNGASSASWVSRKSPTSVIEMNGRQVYNFAVRVLDETILKLLGDEISVDEVRYVVPHQANVRIIEAAAKRLNIPIEKFYVNIDEYGNTSAASIPIALSEMVAKKLLAPGDIVVTVAFGGGLTYGGNLIRW